MDHAVRHLVLDYDGPFDLDTSNQLPSLNDFIRLLPNLESLCVYLCIFEDREYPFDFFPKAFKGPFLTKASEEQEGSSNCEEPQDPIDLIDVTLKVKYEDFKYEDNRPLRWIIQQIRWPSVQTFSFNIEVPRYGKGFDRYSCLSGIIQALDQCDISDLISARLRVALGMTSRDRGIDTCVSRFTNGR
jgi:hypothetical protein